MSVVHLDPQAVLFGKQEVAGVGVRGSITYRITNPTWIGVCGISPPHESNSPNILHSNNTACAWTHLQKS